MILSAQGSLLFCPDADLLSVNVAITIIVIASASILIIFSVKSAPIIRACIETSKKAR